MVLTFFHSLSGEGASYTNWPPTREWSELTNHIAWCYKATWQRIAVLGEESGLTTNMLAPPSYIYPFDDYRRLAETLDQIAPHYVNSKLTLSGVGDYKLYFRPAPHPTEFPFWTATGLHVYCGFSLWATNEPLKAWNEVNTTNLPRQIESALRNLIYTFKSSTEITNPVYAASRSGYSEPRGRNANFFTAANACDDDSPTFSSQMSNGCYAGRSTLYLAALYSHKYPNTTAPAASNSYVVSAKAVAQPVLHGVYTGLACTVSYYIRLQRDSAYGWSPLYDYDANLYAWSLLPWEQGNDHTVIAGEEFVPSRANPRIGEYPFGAFYGLFCLWTIGCIMTLPHGQRPKRTASIKSWYTLLAVH